MTAGRVVLSWLAVLVWAALIFYLSARPNLTLSHGAWGFILRKSAHMAEFAVLCFLAWRAVKQHRVPKTRAIVIAAVLSLLYAMTDEYHQSFVEGRTASATDVGFDLAGIAFVAVVASLAAGRTRQRGSPVTRK